MSIHAVNVRDLESADAPGVKVLVDRIWPRGIKKTELGHDEWLKEAAPSTELRKWFNHDPQRFPEFARRYRTELEAAQSEANADLVKLKKLVGEGDIVLLYSARDREHNQAVVLAEWLSS
ncbi:hypothetical protein COCCU_03625 [Corynebacterium occultum]|uniref:DUF488 domain-containing protein n=1 Tax=Corynebacterium occultum TaxID=2675219 RepID=A0A6B8W407_9CORY|nr:DUF488 family protein [Corynebacterium occultum]QGU06677.1 hypothetical protein COCCU_03625 [Corynebacterium occultum]